MTKSCTVCALSTTKCSPLAILPCSAKASMSSSAIPQISLGLVKKGQARSSSGPHCIQLSSRVCLNACVHLAEVAALCKLLPESLHNLASTF